MLAHISATCCKHAGFDFAKGVVGFSTNNICVGCEHYILESCKASWYHIPIFVGLFHGGLRKTLLNHSTRIFHCNKLTLLLSKECTHL